MNTDKTNPPWPHWKPTLYVVCPIRNLEPGGMYSMVVGVKPSKTTVTTIYKTGNTGGDIPTLVNVSLSVFDGYEYGRLELTLPEEMSALECSSAFCHQGTTHIPLTVKSVQLPKLEVPDPYLASLENNVDHSEVNLGAYVTGAAKRLSYKGKVHTPCPPKGPEDPLDCPGISKGGGTASSCYRCKEDFIRRAQGRAGIMGKHHLTFCIHSKGTDGLQSALLKKHLLEKGRSLDLMNEDYYMVHDPHNSNPFSGGAVTAQVGAPVTMDPGAPYTYKIETEVNIDGEWVADIKGNND